MKQDNSTRSFWFFPNSNSFGVFSHSKGFGAEWLFASLWFSGADPSWASKRFRRRFHQGSTKEGQGSTKATPKFSSFQSLYGSLGQIRRRRFHQGSTKEGQGSTEVPPRRPRFHQGSTVLWGRSVLGFQKVPRKVPPRFHQGRPRFHRGSTKEGQGSTKVPPRSHQGYTKVF